MAQPSDPVLVCWHCGQMLDNPGCKLSSTYHYSHTCCEFCHQLGAESDEYNSAVAVLLKFNKFELAREAVIAAAVGVYKEAARRKWARMVLEDDDFFTRHCRGRFVDWRGRSGEPPVVRASVYGNVVDQDQEFEGPLNFGRDPRRPVLMRGALGRLISRYSHTSSKIANGYCEEIVSRFLRRKKYTCYEYSRYEDEMMSLRHALGRKFRVSHTFFKRSNFFDVGKRPDGTWSAWINGEYFEGLTSPLQIKSCIVCGGSFDDRLRRNSKTCGDACANKRRLINAQRTRVTVKAMKELGLIQTGDLL